MRSDHTGGLLNPPVEAATCKTMVDHVRTSLRNVEKSLTQKLHDRETYLQQFGKASVLRDLLMDLETIYARTFDK